MNVRERFNRIMHFQEVDRPPFCEFLGFWSEAINRWYTEGLPWETTPDNYFGFDAGLTPNLNVYTPSFVFIGELRMSRELLPIDFGPIPQFLPRTLYEDTRHKIIVDKGGITRKILKKGTSIPAFIDFPVKKPEDFDKLKSRYNPNEHKRYPAFWGDEVKEYYKTLDRPIGLHMPGFFGQARNFMGLESLLLNFHKSPEFVKEIMTFWADFIIKTITPAVKSAKIDYASFWEDMCYKNGPFISPKLFKEFMVPCYKKVTNYLREHEIDIILVDTDGNHEALTSLFIEGGVNGLYPLEVQSNMNALKQRRIYGKRLLLIGNIDKKALIAGKDAIDKELETKLPLLLKEGGYVPSIDHAVPVDVSFENYSYYIKQLKKYLSILD